MGGTGLPTLEQEIPFFFFELKCSTKGNNMLKGKFLVNEKCLIKKCSAKGNNMLKGKFSQSFLSHRLPGH